MFMYVYISHMPHDVKVYHHFNSVEINIYDILAMLICHWLLKLNLGFIRNIVGEVCSSYSRLQIHDAVLVTKY